MTHRILIAEDDVDIIDLLSLYLCGSGLEVLSATDGEQALAILQKEQISLMLVDLMMPKMDGYQLIRTVRQTSNLPIIILSARSMEEEKILGLNIGADFYITKPFNPAEVVAYVQSLLRRFYQLGADANAETQTQGVICSGDLELDTRSFTLKKRGKLIPLTSTELKLVAAMMKKPGQIFTKAQLYECLNGNYLESDSNTVMVHISNIRSKLEDNPGQPEHIITVRGLGYKFEAR